MDGGRNRSCRSRDFNPAHVRAGLLMTPAHEIVKTLGNSSQSHLPFMAPFYSATDLTSSVEWLGDISGDGDVNAGDYTLWANNFGIAEPSYGEGDMVLQARRGRRRRAALSARPVGRSSVGRRGRRRGQALLVVGRPSGLDSRRGGDAYQHTVDPLRRVRQYLRRLWGLQHDNGEAPWTRFTYTGQEFDLETGLYFYDARYYDPDTGRFLAEDPLAFAGGDANLYRYAGNNPVTFVDPTGLSTARPTSSITGGFGGFNSGGFSDLNYDPFGNGSSVSSGISNSGVGLSPFNSSFGTPIDFAAGSTTVTSRDSQGRFIASVTPNVGGDPSFTERVQGINNTLDYVYRTLSPIHQAEAAVFDSWREAYRQGEVALRVTESELERGTPTLEAIYAGYGNAGGELLGVSNATALVHRTDIQLDGDSLTTREFGALEATGRTGLGFVQLFLQGRGAQVQGEIYSTVHSLERLDR